MRRLIVQVWTTLDGVVQAPGAADEDPSGGFRHGGWSRPYFDELAQRWVLDNLAEAGGLLLGRRTYESFAGHWPDASEEERPLAEPLNALPKHVASTTLREPLGWRNATLLEGEAAAAVAGLKRQDGGTLLLIGSVGLLHTLVGRGLVDEYRLMIDPLVVGGGKRLFPADGARRDLRLVDSAVTTTGAILATYAPAPR
jgi:dihydrofolate reductase